MGGWEADPVSPDLPGTPLEREAVPPSVALADVLADLSAEGDELDAIVAGLTDEQWRADTAANGWTIAHQIAHLAWTDNLAVLAATDPHAFQYEATKLAAGDKMLTAADLAAQRGAGQPPAELLARWRAGRHELSAALTAVPPGEKLPWFGPPMSSTAMATARLMETFAHGKDVADAVGVTRPPTSRLRHVAWLGYRARSYAYVANGRTPPRTTVRVELTAPDGSTWTYGPADAEQRVTGSAVDFCLLVTQRVHRDDTNLVAIGADADDWLSIAQAFAGPPGGGRAPRESAS
jgi:uncharacterized protein (TIGR03084 family)